MSTQLELLKTPRELDGARRSIWRRLLFVVFVTWFWAVGVEVSHMLGLLVWSSWPALIVHMLAATPAVMSTPGVVYMVGSEPFYRQKRGQHQRALDVTDTQVMQGILSARRDHSERAASELDVQMTDLSTQASTQAWWFLIFMMSTVLGLLGYVMVFMYLDGGSSLKLAWFLVQFVCIVCGMWTSLSLLRTLAQLRMVHRQLTARRQIGEQLTHTHRFDAR